MGKDKKEEKKVVDKYLSRSTGDLLKIIDSYHADTDEARGKREDVEAETIAQASKLEDVEASYLVKKRGEHASNKGRPKRYKIENKEEAAELINLLALEGIKKEYGNDAAKSYEKDPHKISAYLAGKGVDYHGLLLQVMEKPSKFRTLEEYQKFKQNLVSIDTLVEQRYVRTLLSKHPEHYQNLVKSTNERISPQNVEISSGLEGEDVLGHYINAVRKSINGEYISEHHTHFKKKPKKK